MGFDSPKVYLYRRVLRAKAHIEENYQEHLDLDEIAGEAAYSKYHFLRLFRNIVGQTPHQYLTKIRLEKAGDLLQHGMPVNEVCHHVGFESVSSFTAIFKRAKSLTPCSFRAQALARRQALIEKPLNFVPYCFAQARGFTIAISEK